MSEPTPRQVLYGLVAAGFLVVVLVLIVGAASAGLTPTWWTVATSILLLLVGTWSALRWRRTVPVLLASIALLLIWTVGTLLVT